MKPTELSCKHSRSRESKYWPTKRERMRRWGGGDDPAASGEEMGWDRMRKGGSKWLFLSCSPPVIPTPALGTFSKPFLAKPAAEGMVLRETWVVQKSQNTKSNLGLGGGCVEKMFYPQHLLLVESVEHWFELGGCR